MSVLTFRFEKYFLVKKYLRHQYTLRNYNSVKIEQDFKWRSTYVQENYVKNCYLKRHNHPLPNYFQHILIYKVEHPVRRKWHSHPIFIFRRILFKKHFPQIGVIITKTLFQGKYNKFTFVSINFCWKCITFAWKSKGFLLTS